MEKVLEHPGNYQWNEVEWWDFEYYYFIGLETWVVLIFDFFFFVLGRSLQRALDQRLYLLLHGPAYGSPSGNPCWHFPEKAYESEETLRAVIVLSSLYFPFYENV